MKMGPQRLTWKRMRTSTKLQSRSTIESREQFGSIRLYYQRFRVNMVTLILRALGDVTVYAIRMSTRSAKVHPHPATSTLPFSHYINLEMKIRRLQSLIRGISRQAPVSNCFLGTRRSGVLSTAGTYLCHIVFISPTAGNT